MAQFESGGWTQTNTQTLPHHTLATPSPLAPRITPPLPTQPNFVFWEMRHPRARRTLHHRARFPPTRTRRQTVTYLVLVVEPHVQRQNGWQVEGRLAGVD